MINTILNNSEGWNAKDPIPNQDREPFLMIPMPGLMTKINRIREINISFFEYFA